MRATAVAITSYLLYELNYCNQSQWCSYSSASAFRLWKREECAYDTIRYDTMHQLKIEAIITGQSAFLQSFFPSSPSYPRDRIILITSRHGKRGIFTSTPDADTDQTRSDDVRAIQSMKGTRRLVESEMERKKEWISLSIAYVRACVRWVKVLCWMGVGVHAA